MTKLTIELVPKTSWFKNIRSECSQKQWDDIRRYVYKKSNYKCDVCGGKGNKHPVECHEIFIYDDENKIQKLSHLTSLCPLCHSVKHIGLTMIRGKYDLAKKHLAKVNEWSIEDAENYIQVQFEIWNYRSNFEWKIDLSFLKEFNKKIGEQHV